MGDSSDNISSVFKKCGPKTAIKCYDEPEYFNAKLKKEDAYKNMNLTVYWSILIVFLRIYKRNL